MNNRKNRNLATGAIIAAFYVTLTYAQQMLLPGTAFAELRVSEMLNVLALFTPAAIPGLTVGCMLSNLLCIASMPLDVILGSGATFLASLCMYKLRNVKVKDIPFLALTMPAIFNGVIVGLELEIFFVKGPFSFTGFVLQGGMVAVGEIAVCFTLGILLYKIINGKNLKKYIN